MTLPTVRPTFSIVSAVYNVARYLPEFITSIEAQTRPLDDVEVILVDDGSTDESLSVIRAWQDRRPDLVTVLERPNGGQAAARNDGMDVARGTWITFTDPDDTLDLDYLLSVHAAIQRWPDVDMIATNRIILRDETGELVDGHPLRRFFEHRDQIKDLDRFPEFFHGSAPAAFLRRDLIEQHHLRFDVRIRPNFEDGQLLQRYLLRCDQRTVAFLRSARYHYRKRADQSSTLQTGHMDTRRFREVPRHGFLELLQEGVELCEGRAPVWLQNMLIYELSYYISPEDSSAGNATACRGPVAEEFVAILREIRVLLDDDIIDGFNSRRLRVEWYQLLKHGLDDTPWHSDVVLHRYDKTRQEVLLSYRWTGPEPDLEILLRGEVVQPSTTKIRAWEYFDHVLMRERMVWVSAAGTIGVRLAGKPAVLRNWWLRQPRLQLRPTALRRALGAQPRLARPDVSRRERLKRSMTLRLAASRLVRRRFGHSWVLMDRVIDADDSGEILFSHLRRNRPDVNAWFVIDRRTADGKRVRKTWGRRVVAYRSLRWKLLMLNAKHLVSSHADVPVIDPPEIRELTTKTPWKTTFLQHGVIKNDISSWLNPKPLDLFITSTPAEHASIISDGTRWKFTDKEARLLGLPRLDDLRRRDQEHGEAPRDLVLVAPTWRDSLNKPRQPGEVTREIVDDFENTDWAHHWFGLLRSSNLERACREHGLTIGFLPHPNLQGVLSDLSLPSHVQALTYDDVRALFPRTAVLVTDYSSIVFNTAFLDRTAVYFQFDEDRINAGGHLGRAGYYDYRRDGYGPVTNTLDEAVTATISSLDAQGRMQQPYLDRAAKDFALVRDGKCCERVVDAIESL